MRQALSVMGLLAGLLARPASAAPGVDVVVVWAPHRAELLASALGAARTRGLAVVDTSPAPSPALADAAALREGQTAYADLRFDEAVAALSRAASSLDATGGAGMTQHQLADVFFTRALAQIQLGAASAAWDDLVRAAVLAPARVLDPAQLPPRAVEQFERARAHVSALPRHRVAVTREPACQVTLDGTLATDSELSLPRGWHYLVAVCPGFSIVQKTFEVAAEMTVTARGAPLPPLSEEAALIQARALGASALVLVTSTSDAFSLRRLGIDGRERGRSSVLVAARDAERALERELGALTHPAPRPRSPWYRSPWAWAAAGFVAASAVFLPLALSSDEPPPVVIRPQGAPW